MLDIGAIWKSHYLGTSSVVLVQKKDSSLRFCIDLRKLNWTIKDAYSLPHIDKTLDSLWGFQWFSSLNLKLGYWQVKMDAESKPLTAFTVGLLGFYKYKRMPFGLTNAPTTFQRLMETCLGDLSLHWCIIYLRWHCHLLQGSNQPPWEARGCALETGGGWTKAQAFQMWAIPMADCLLGAHDFCPRSSHWWGQNQSYQKVTNTHNHHRGPKFLGIHRIYYHQFIPKFTQVAQPLHKLTLGWECWQEKGCHPVGQQMSTGLWWP